MEKSDTVLADVGRQLLARSPYVYRAGTEKFLIRLQGDSFPSLPLIQEIEFRRSIVSISVESDPHYASHFVEGVLWYCWKGLLFGGIDQPGLFELTQAG